MRLMLPLAPTGSFKPTNLLPLPKVFHGLFRRRIHEINAKGLGSAPSGMLGYIFIQLCAKETYA